MRNVQKNEDRLLVLRPAFRILCFLFFQLRPNRRLVLIKDLGHLEIQDLPIVLYCRFLRIVYVSIRNIFQCLPYFGPLKEGDGYLLRPDVAFRIARPGELK